MMNEQEYLNLEVVDLMGKDKIWLEYDQQIEQQLIEEAQNGYPLEITGFLLGKKEVSHRVSELYPVENIASNQERRFEIHGLDYLKVENYALQNDLDVIGVYHSHPDYPAIPSRHDLEYAQEVFSYLIISVDGGGNTLINSWKKEAVRDHSLETKNGKFINQKIKIS